MSKRAEDWTEFDRKCEEICEVLQGVREDEAFMILGNVVARINILIELNRRKQQSPGRSQIRISYECI